MLTNPYPMDKQLRGNFIPTTPTDTMKRNTTLFWEAHNSLALQLHRSHACMRRYIHVHINVLIKAILCIMVHTSIGNSIKG